MQTLVVVGASLAGLSAARAARANGYGGRLVIVGDEARRPYDRPPLSKNFLAGKLAVEELDLEDGDEGLDVEWRLGAGAEFFAASTRTLFLTDGSSLCADSVVIATGASARQHPRLAGMRNAFTLRTLADAQALAAYLQPGSRLAVVGGGFIGSEAASTAHSLGVDVTVIERSAVPLRGALGPQMGAAVARLHAAAGVELLCGTEVASVTYDDGAVTSIGLDNGREVPVDVVLVGIGSEPNIHWLQGSGLELGDGVICDSMGRTNTAGVVAVGDCAAWYDESSRRHRRVEHWTGAIEGAALAVAGLLGAPAASRALPPAYFWSDQYQTRIQCAGDPHAADRVEIECGSIAENCFLAVYYAGSDPVAVLGLNQVRQFTRWRKSLARITERQPERAPGTAYATAS